MCFLSALQEQTKWQHKDQSNLSMSLFSYLLYYLMQMYRTVKGTTADRSCAAGKTLHTCQLQKHFFSVGSYHIILAELLAWGVPG